ncbi:MAG: transpeptidase family protein [Bacteroidia bacterium]
MNIKKSILWRVAICFAAVVLFGLWVSYEMLHIQIKEGDKWLSLSDSTSIKKQEISPTRGNIYSDNGSLLATSMPSYEVRFDPTVVDRDSFNRFVGALAEQMARLYPEYSASYYKNKLVRARNKGSRYMLIRRRANYNEWQAMKQWPIFRMGRYKGGMISLLTTRRVRPAGQLAYRTIGYRTKDNPGVGLEREYDEVLAGVSGSRLVQKISGGYRPLNADNLIEPQNGQDIHTTLNVDFQEIAHMALSKAIVKHKADHGCVLIMDIKTGEVKAIVNLKNDEETGPREAYNYAIGESIEPGSVFKVFSAMAALEDGIISPDDTLDLYNGVRMYSGRPMKDSDIGKYKKLSFKSAFARSSNVIFSSVIYDNYKKKPADYIAHLKRLELHKKTGIKILGEPDPYLNQPSFKSWSSLALPWLAIGYENQHTPLQVLTAYNAVINGGILVKPSLVSRVSDAGIVDKDYEEEQDPTRVCSEETSTQILDFTKETVLVGTARNIKSDVVSMGGKTGTAQIASSAGYQARRQYNASFVGHFPADNPVYSVIVVINKPSAGVFYASYVAAPVFKELAEKIFTISVLQDLNTDTLMPAPSLKGYGSDFNTLNELISSGSVGETYDGMIYKDTSTSEQVILEDFTMPDIRGMGVRDAVYLLESEGYKVKMSGYGRVIRQSPRAGEIATKGRTIFLQLGL